MLRMRSCLFTAEMRGGLWNSAPVCMPHISGRLILAKAEPYNVSLRRHGNENIPLWEGKEGEFPQAVPKYEVNHIHFRLGKSSLVILDWRGHT